MPGESSHGSAMTNVLPFVFAEAKPLPSDYEVAFNCGRVAVFAMNAHKRSEAEKRVGLYLSQIGGGVKIQRFLGDGTDGAVWSTNRDSAVKAFFDRRGYVNERDAYERLAWAGVEDKLDGFWIPQMIHCDEDLQVIEMDFMQNPPYIIDFAKVKIDESPEFSDEVLEESEERCARNLAITGQPSGR